MIVILTISQSPMRSPWTHTKFIASVLASSVPKSNGNSSNNPVQLYGGGKTRGVNSPTQKEEYNGDSIGNYQTTLQVIQKYVALFLGLCAHFSLTIGGPGTFYHMRDRIR